MSGGGAFTELERMAAQIDYSADETNYTFALTTLAARLTRRSMIILFTEFADTVSADFMLRAIRTLVETHLVARRRAPRRGARSDRGGRAAKRPTT